MWSTIDGFLYLQSIVFMWCVSKTPLVFPVSIGSSKGKFLIVLVIGHIIKKPVI